MTTPILKGTKTPQLQWWEADFSPTRGSRSAQEWRGIDITQMGALAQTYMNSGWSGKLRYEKNVATLHLESTYTAGVPGVSGGGAFLDIVDKWEVAVDSEKPELFENMNFLNLFTTVDAAYGVPVSQQVFSVIKQTAGSAAPTWKGLIENLKATNAVDANGTDLTPNITLYSACFTFLIYVKYFSDDYFRGRTNFVHGKYVLRHTTSAPQNYGLNVADFNVEKIYSISQLLSEAQSSMLWILPLPAYLAYKILAYPVPVAMPPNYAWGGLKMRSDAITAARNRIEIKTEYLIDACPKHTYGLIS